MPTKCCCKIRLTIVFADALPDDVHAENKIRYKKIKQIANTIIDELKFKNTLKKKRILNLSGEAYPASLNLKQAG